METCQQCSRTGMTETTHFIIQLICSHIIHARCLEKAQDCLGCRDIYVKNKRKLFLRAKMYAERQVPEEFNAFKWDIGMSGYLRMIISLGDDGRIVQKTSFVKYGIIQHPICIAAQRDKWEECERYAEKRWEEIQYMDKRRLEEKEATRKMNVWILNRIENDEGVVCE